MRGVSDQRQPPVDEPVGNVLGDRRTDDGPPVDAVADDIAPERGPQLHG